MRALPLVPGVPAAVAVDATLRAAALRHAAAATLGRRRVEPVDLRRRLRLQPGRALVLLLVDASESMAVRARVAAAKGALLALLASAYQRRDLVALVVFEGEGASVLLRPTPSVALAQHRLQALPVGGATPLAHGLLAARELMRQQRARDRAVEPLLVLISDGDANVPLCTGRDPLGEALVIARALRAEGVRALAVDTATGPPRERAMPRIAQALGATYHHIVAPGAGALLALLQADAGRSPRRAG